MERDATRRSQGKSEDARTYQHDTAKNDRQWSRRVQGRVRQELRDTLRTDSEQIVWRTQTLTIIEDEHAMRTFLSENQVVGQIRRSGSSMKLEAPSRGERVAVFQTYSVLYTRHAAVETPSLDDVITNPQCTFVTRF